MVLAVFNELKHSICLSGALMSDAFCLNASCGAGAAQARSVGADQWLPSCQDTCSAELK